MLTDSSHLFTRAREIVGAGKRFFLAESKPPSSNWLFHCAIRLACTLNCSANSDRFFSPPERIQSWFALKNSVPGRRSLSVASTRKLWFRVELFWIRFNRLGVGGARRLVAVHGQSKTSMENSRNG